MKIKSRVRSSAGRPLTCAAAILVCAAAGYGQQRAIAAANSEVTVRVYKAGVFSAFGHDHEITAPLAGGMADVGAHKVELRVNANALRVRDPGASEKDREEIQKTMLGPQVLDAARHPDIVFRSTAVETSGEGAWTVRGTLSLHGESRPVVVQVREREGRYVGSARLKQSDFGIKPIKIAGGTVRVKDEVRVDFDIQLEPKKGSVP